MYININAENFFKNTDLINYFITKVSNFLIKFGNNNIFIN